MKILSVFATGFLIAGLNFNVYSQVGAINKPAVKVRQNCSSVTQETCEIAHALGRGVNMGTMLDAPREGDWGVTLEPEYIVKATEIFTTVRLPVRWSNHAAATADATLDEVFAARVDKIIDSLLEKGVYVILDVHHYSQLSGAKLHYNEFAVDPAVVQIRFFNIWDQLAKRYKSKSPKLLFEILNEPTGPLEGEGWNRLSTQALKIIRSTNPTRVVVIGPSGNRIPSLKDLVLPADKNLIVGFHNYDPFTFTHQGLEHLKQFPKGPICCSAKNHTTIIEALDTAKKWNQKNGYPMHFGEFGSNDIADMKSREAYTRIARDEAESRGFGWTYWEFASGFGVYDTKKGQWVEPIRRALMD